MSKKKTRKVEAQVIKSQNQPVLKAELPMEISEHEVDSAEWINPSANLEGYKNLVNGSTILPQCICAYKKNIAGFGLGVRYIEDEEETDEKANEFIRATELIDLLGTEKATKEVFEDLIDSRETYGIGYLEIIRNLKEEVSQINFINDTETVKKSVVGNEIVDYEYFYKGRKLSRKKRFRKYRQQKGGLTRYYKEFGDPRIMNVNTGEYIEKSASLNINQHANEILEFTVGTEEYGTVRWIGQVLGIDGSRKAEELNNRYFVEGRHTPLAIIVRGGTLSENSYSKLQEYMNDIKGEKGQHAFLVLELEENGEAKTAFDEGQKPDVELKDLASVLQQDELFQNYMENNRRKVQSSFRLPDLYVGYTTDFNRATAQTAMEVTEEQVFQPERESLEWIINNKLLNGYSFKHVEIYFKKPEISNPDDVAKILNIAERAGGLTPNKAKQIGLNAIGEESEEYDGDWANIPLALLRMSGTPALNDIKKQLDNKILKAASEKETELVAVMKEVRSLLERGEDNV